MYKKGGDLLPKISDEKIEIRKSKILESAFDVFSEKGFKQASMQDIVEHSGISKGGLYTYYKSKEEIFLAIAEKRFLIRNRLIQEMPITYNGIEKMTHYLQSFLERFVDENTRKGMRFTIEFWSLQCKDPGTAELAENRYAKFEKDLEILMRAGIEDGSFREDLDVKSMSYLILSNLDGMGFMDSVMGISVTKEAIQSYIDMVIGYMRRN